MAFSLRDFIYSQDLPQSLPDGDLEGFGSLPNFVLPSPIPFGHTKSTSQQPNAKKIDDSQSNIDNRYESEREESPKKGETKKSPKTRRFTTKQAKKPPEPKLHGSGQLLYDDSPQLVDATKFTRGNHVSVLQYLCNEPDYLIFQQRDGPLLSELRHNVKEIFDRCFEGQDFVGALQALRCLSEVDTVFFDEVVKLLKTISILPPQHADLQSIINQFSTTIPKSLPSESKADLLQALAHMLVSRGDLKGAKAFLKSNRKRTVDSHFTRLLALDSIIILLQLLSLSSEAIAVMQLKPFPTTSPDVFVELPWVFFSVRLLHHLSAGGSSSLLDESSDLRPRSKTLLNEINVSLASSACREDAYDWAAFQLLYLCVLTGQGNLIKAQEQIGVIQQRLLSSQDGLEEVEQQTRTAALCDLMIRYCILLSGEKDSAPVHDLLCLCYRLLKSCAARFLSREKQCYLSLFSLMNGLVTREECMQVFTDAIENISTSSYSVSHHDQLKEKLLWRILAALLGPLQQEMTYQAPISASNTTQKFIPEMVIANEMYANGSYRSPYYSSNVHLHNENDGDVLKRFSLEREWWVDFILSPSQLDELSACLIELDIEPLLHLLEDQDISEMTSLPPLQLYRQSANSFLNRWRACETQFYDADVHVDSIFAQQQAPIHSSDLFDANLFPVQSDSTSEQLHNLDQDVVDELFALLVDDSTFPHPMLHLRLTDLSEADTDLDQHFALKSEIIDIPVWHLSNKQTYNRTNVWCGRVQRQEAVIIMGKGRLETLTYKALTAAHLQDQDCLFTIRVVQVICRHAIMQFEAGQRQGYAMECLSFLHSNGINVRRAIAKGVEFACRDIPMDEAPPQFFKGPSDEVYCSGELNAYYQPLPFTGT